MSIRIIGSGSYIPVMSLEKPKQINAFGEFSNINILSGSGTRHICNDYETPTYMGTQAAINAINNTGIDPKSIDTIICYSAVSDYETPRDVYKIANDIGCDGAMCWTIDTACASFLTHLHCACSLSLGGKKRILIINTLNWVSRAFSKDDDQYAGDGAGAVIVESSNSTHYIACKEISSTAQFEFITLKTAQVSGKREEIKFTTNRNTIIRSIEILPEIAQQLLDENSIKKDDINWVISHQPGIPAIERWHDILDIPINKNLNTYDLYGNMSAANIPVTLDYFMTEKPVLKKDDLILFFSAGAGIHVAATLYRI